MQTVRFRIDFNESCSIGPGKIDLLDAIARSGSISKAASDLNMSYRRAWLLVDSVNRSFREPATRSSIGGSGGGGVELTPFGADLIRRYRIASRKIARITQSEFSDLAGLAVKDSRGGHRRLPKAQKDQV